MPTTSISLRRSARIAGAVLSVILISVGASLLARSVGDLLFPALLVALVAAVAIQWPQVALALALVPAVLFEESGGLAFGVGGAFYHPIAFATPIEASLLLLALATICSIAAKQRFVVPGALTGPLVLGLVAVVVGAAIGLGAGTSLKDVLFLIRPMLVVLLMPFVVVNLIEGRAGLRRFLIVAAALTAVKAGIGVITVIGGGVDLSANEPATTYMSPVVNWLCVALLLYVVAMVVDRERPPWPLLAIACLAAVSLLLSYRRSFWLAMVAGLLIVFLAAGARGWRAALPIVTVVCGIALVLALAAGISGLSGPLEERAESLRPGSVETNVQDRYRIDERRNVLSDIAEHPIAGIGVGVPWTARYALPVDRDGSRHYVHFTALWWWLQYGLLALVAYLWMMAVAVWTAYRVWREQMDPVLKAGGLAAVGALSAIAIVETTASFTGMTIRFSLIFGAALGFLAATLLEARKARERGSGAGSRPGIS